MSELMKEAKRLREERARAAKQLHELVKLTVDEKRSLTGEEQVKFNKIEADCVDLEKRFTDIEKAASFSTADAEEQKAEQRDRQAHAINRAGGIPLDVQERAQAAWFRYGTNAWTTRDEEAANLCGVNFRDKFFTIGLPSYRGEAARTVNDLRRMMRDEPNLIRWNQPAYHINPGEGGDIAITRATTSQTVTTTGGGHTIANAPMAALEEGILSTGTMRQVATVIRTANGANWPVPTAADNTAGTNVAISTEVVTANTTFGQHVLGAYKYTSGGLRIPLELAQDTSIDLPSYIARLAGRRIARVQETEFATGAATLTQCEGLITTGSSGGATVGTSQSSAANVQYADLVSLVHYVDINLRNAKQSQFMFHDSVLANLRGQLDGYGRPLWVPSVAAGVPDTILGYPYVVNNAYNAFTGSTVGMGIAAKIATFGPHSDYWIRDCMGVTLMRLDERYAEFGEVGYLAFARSFGRYVHALSGTTDASIRCMVATAS